MNKKIKFLGAILLLLFQTAKSQITTYPSITDFESESNCTGSCNVQCNLTGVWRNGNQWSFPPAATYWTVDNGGTSSSNTGPDIDHTLGTSIGKYVYIETSGCNNIQAHLVSEVFDFSGLSAPKLNFWYHMYGATMGTMHVDVDTTGLGDWVLDVTPSWTDNIDLWQEKTVDLSLFAGLDSVRLRIRGNTGTSFTSDMAVDDITVFEPAPYDLSAYSITPNNGCGLGIETICIHFINFGSDAILTGDSIQGTYVINGGTPVSETFYVLNTINPGDTVSYCFSQQADLTISSTYNIQVYTSYSGDTINNNNDTVSTSITNIPLYSTFPVLEDFENGQNGWSINNGPAGTWAFGTPNGATIIGAASGINAFCTGNLTGSYNNSDNSYVQGACYDFTNVCDPTIRLNVWWNAEFSWDGANISTSTDGGNSWQLVGNFGDPNNWYNDNTIVGNPGGFQEGWSGRNSTSNGSGGWVSSTHKLSGLGGFSDVLIRVNFGTDGSVTDNGFAFDDVLVYDGIYLNDVNAICIGDSTFLNVQGITGDTYLWNTGETSQSIYALNNAWYSCQYTSGICTNTDSVFVTVIDSLNENFVSLGSDLQVCDTMITLNAGPMSSINWVWSTGDSTSTTTLSGIQNSQIILTGTSNLAGCPATDVDTIQVNILGFNSVSLGLDTIACGELILDAGPGQVSYLWANGNTSQTLDFGAEFGTTTYNNLWVEVMNSDGCMAYDTITATLLASPIVSLGNDQTSCSTVLLDAGSGFSNYLWSTGATTQTVLISSSQTVSLIVENADGCQGFDTVNISIIDCSGLDEIHDNEYTIYPNPASNEIQLNINSMTKTEYLATIINSNGQEVITLGLIPVKQGNQIISINLENLIPGFYILRLKNPHSIQNLKFLVKH